MQPVWLDEGRKVARQLGVDIVVFEYRIKTRLTVNGRPSQRVIYDSWGLDTVEGFEYYARNFEILHSAVVSPYEGE